MSTSSLFCRVALVGLVCLPGAFGVGAVRAELCSVDDVPAATLLLPYFEVELDDPEGRTTLFSINNARAEPTLAHAVLWSDLGVPTLDFDIYLTGYDVLTVNLRDLFNGVVPVTNPVGPVGEFSLPNSQFPGCESILPLPSNLPLELLEHLRNLHTGGASALFGGRCAGIDFGDRVARGYLTVDVVRACSLLFPTEEGYFGPQGVLAHDNVLWGDFYLVDPGENLAQGENLVRLESDPEAFGPGDRTFYGPYVDGDGSDGREPLPWYWGSRFAQGGAFNGGTELLVWRSPPRIREAFTCDTPLESLYLDRAHEAIAFDEEENPEFVAPCVLIPFPGIPTEPVLPLASQRVDVADLPCPPPQFGWLAADLRGLGEGGLDEGSQGWMMGLLRASGRFSVSVAGSPLTPSCEGGCALGDQVEAGQICVRGSREPITGQELLNLDEPIQVQIWPRGCFSSTCTRIHEVSCQVAAPQPGGASLNVSARFCLAERTGTCSADCSGGGTALCRTQALPRGSYSVTVGDLSVAFDVPSTIPAGGLCTGSPF